MSMTRLDQLARPIRRHGEHISAIVERERRLHLENLNGEAAASDSNNKSTAARKKSMSRSMTHLAGNRNRVVAAGSISNRSTTPQLHAAGAASKRDLSKNGLSPSKSMCHLAGGGGGGDGRGSAGKSGGSFLKTTTTKILSKVAQQFSRGKKESSDSGVLQEIYQVDKGAGDSWPRINIQLFYLAAS